MACAAYSRQRGNAPTVTEADDVGTVFLGITPLNGLLTSSKSLAPSFNYAIYTVDGKLYKFGVSAKNGKRLAQSLAEAGEGATARVGKIIPKYQAHIFEKYLRSLHFASTGEWEIPGMIYPYPRNLGTGWSIKKP